MNIYEANPIDVLIAVVKDADLVKKSISPRKKNVNHNKSIVSSQVGYRKLTP